MLAAAAMIFPHVILVKIWFKKELKLVLYLLGIYVYYCCSPTDGVPLSELSWSSSLAVVAVSFSGLFTFIFLMLACLCCKKGEIGFKVRTLLNNIKYL